MRGKRVLIVLLAAVFVVASATGANSTADSRVALARISPVAKPAVPVVVVLPTTTTMATTAPVTTSTTARVRVRAQGPIALTFDDGPSPEFTPQVLDILARYNVKANFFLVGSEAELNPDLVRRIVAEGHTIGNHTWDHVALPTLDDAGFVAQIDRTQELLRTFTDRPANCVRPPFGKVDDRSRAAVHQRGLAVQRWTRDSNDWRRPGVDAIVASILAGIEPHAVMLLHDGGPDMSQTVAALPTIIESIHARGFRFAPIC